MLDIISKREFDHDGFHVVVSRILDLDADLSYLEQDYAEESEKNRRLYLTQDAKRLASYRAGDWYMLGIAVDIHVQTETNWTDGGPIVGRASVWGFESDSEESYLKSEEENIIVEAFAEVNRLRKVLCLKKEN